MSVLIVVVVVVLLVKTVFWLWLYVASRCCCVRRPCAATALFIASARLNSPSDSRSGSNPHSLRPASANTMIGVPNAESPKRPTPSKKLAPSSNTLAMTLARPTTMLGS